MSTRDKRKCFTFTWTIENISYNWLKEGDYIRSPVFVINELESEYILELHPRGFHGHFFSIYLMKQKRSVIVTIEWELALLSKDGIVIKLQKENSIEACASLHMEKEDFAINGSTYLADEKIIVRCRIWKGDGELTEDVKCDAVTRICIKKEAFIWKIRNFSTLQSEEKCTYQIKSMPNNEVLMTLDLLLKNPYTDENSINIQLVSKNDKIKYCILHLMPFNSFGSINQGIRKEFLFSDYKMPKVFSLPFSKNDLIADKDLCLPNNVLSFRCECTFSTGDFTNEIESVIYGCESLASIEPDNQCFEGNILSTSKRILNDNLKSMLYDNIFSDIKLKTNTKTFPAHKSILGARSPVFKSVFSANMKEKFNNCVDIEDFDSDTVHRMLQYIYTAEIKDLQWESAFELYRAADKYEILALRDECSAYIKSNLSPKNACNALILADMHQDEDLKASVQEFIFNHDIFDSEEWKHLIKTHLKLTADTMYLHIQRKLKSPGNNCSMIEELFGKKPAKLNSASSEFKSPTTKTTSTSPVLSSNTVNKPSQTSCSFDNCSANQSFAPSVLKANSDQPSPAFSGLSNSEGDSVRTSYAFNSNKTETPSEWDLKFGWIPSSKTETVYSGSNSNNMKLLSTSKGFNLSTKEESSFGNSSQTTPVKPSFSFENISDKESVKSPFSFGSSDKKEPIKTSFSFGNVSEKESVKSAFSFGSNKKEPIKTSFSFGNVSKKKSVKSPFSFGSTDKKEPIKPSFSFGNVSEKESVKSPFSFGSSDKKEPIKTSFSFGNNNWKEPVKPSSSFGFNEKESSKLSFSFGRSDKKEFVASSFFGGNSTKIESIKTGFSFGYISDKESIKSSFPFQNCSDKDPIKPCLTFVESDDKKLAKQSVGSSDTKETSFLFGSSAEKESVKKFVSHSSSDVKEPVIPSVSFGSSNEREPVKSSFFLNRSSGKELINSSSFANSGDKEHVKSSFCVSNNSEKEPDKPSFLFFISNVKESINNYSLVSSGEEARSPSSRFNNGTEQKHLEYHRLENNSSLTTCAIKGSVSAQMSSVNDSNAKISSASLGFKNINENRSTEFPIISSNSEAPTAPKGITSIIPIKPSEPIFSFGSLSMKTPSSSSGFNSNNEAIHSSFPASHTSSVTTPVSPTEETGEIRTASTKIPSATIGCSSSSLDVRETSGNDITSAKIPSELNCTDAEKPSICIGCDSNSIDNTTTSVKNSSSVKMALTSFELNCTSEGRPPNSECRSTSPDKLSTSGIDSGNLKITPASPGLVCSSAETSSKSTGFSNNPTVKTAISGIDSFIAKMPSTSSKLDCTSSETPASNGCDSSSPDTPATSVNNSSSVKMPLTSFELNCTSEGRPSVNSGCRSETATTKQPFALNYTSAEKSYTAVGLDINCTETSESSKFDSTYALTPASCVFDSTNESTHSLSHAFDSSSAETPLCSGFNSATSETQIPTFALDSDNREISTSSE